MLRKNVLFLSFLAIASSIYSQNLVTNGHFPSGLNGWGQIGTPQTSSIEGCLEAGSAQFWGNQVVGEGIRQPINFQKGKSYQLSFCGIFLPTVQPNARFRFRATSGAHVIGSNPPNYFPCDTPACEQIFLSPILTLEWTTFTSPVWTPSSDFDNLVITMWNNENEDNGALVSWGRIDDIEIIEIQTCEADFEYTSNTCATFNFINNSTGNMPTYQWDFGDGNTSNEANPIYTYTQTGNYNVCLRVNDGTCEEEYCEMVNAVIDSESPEIFCENVNVVSQDPLGTIVPFEMFAFDNCGDVELNYSPAPNSMFDCGFTTVTVTGTDDAGNGRSCTFDVNVQCDDFYHYGLLHRTQENLSFTQSNTATGKELTIDANDSGIQGFYIELGETFGHNMNLRFPNPNDLEVGEYMEIDYSDPANSQPNASLSKTKYMVAEIATSKFYQFSAPRGSTEYQVRVLNETGTEIYSAFNAPDFIYGLASSIGDIGFETSYCGGCYRKLVTPALFIPPNGGAPIQLREDYRIEVSETLTALDIVKICEVRINGLGGTKIGTEKIIMFEDQIPFLLKGGGGVHHAKDAGQTLTVNNLGATGGDGLIWDLALRKELAASITDNAEIYAGISDVMGQDQPDSYMNITAAGKLDPAVPKFRLAYLKNIKTDMPNRYEIIPDFSPINATTINYQFYNDGNMVAEMTADVGDLPTLYVDGFLENVGAETTPENDLILKRGSLQEQTYNYDGQDYIADELQVSANVGGAYWLQGFGTYTKDISQYTLNDAEVNRFPDTLIGGDEKTFSALLTADNSNDEQIVFATDGIQLADGTYRTIGIATDSVEVTKLHFSALDAAGNPLGIPKKMTFGANQVLDEIFSTPRILPINGGGFAVGATLELGGGTDPAFIQLDNNGCEVKTTIVFNDNVNRGVSEKFKDMVQMPNGNFLMLIERPGSNRLAVFEITAAGVPVQSKTYGLVEFSFTPTAITAISGLPNSNVQYSITGRGGLNHSEVFILLLDGSLNPVGDFFMYDLDGNDGSIDFPTDIIQNGDNIAVCGTTSIDSQSGTPMFLLNIKPFTPTGAQDGSILISQYYDPTNSNGLGGETIRPLSMKLTPENDFIIAGINQNSGDGNFFPFVLKIDNTGTPLWAKDYAETVANRGFNLDVEITSDNDYFFVGTKFTFPNISETSMWAAKSKADGTFEGGGCETPTMPSQASLMPLMNTIMVAASNDGTLNYDPGANCLDIPMSGDYCNQYCPPMTGDSCVADFSTIVDPCTGLVTFTNSSTSTNTTITYQWDFGDNNQSTNENPTHQYSSNSTYQVCLTVTSGDCTNQKCDNVVVAFDDVPPTSVCDQNFVVDVSSGSAVVVDASDLDAGSYDDDPNCQLSFRGLDKLIFDCGAACSSISMGLEVEDCCGNLDTCNAIIQVIERIPPTIDCPPIFTVSIGGDPNDTGVTGTPTSIDNCDPSPLFTSVDNTISSCPDNSDLIIRTWTATDQCGNFDTCQQEIFVECESTGRTDTIPCGDESVFYQVLEGRFFVKYDPVLLKYDTIYKNPTDTVINAIGYNCEDGFIYGIKTNSTILMRTGSSGIFEELGSVNGLTQLLPGKSYYTGDFDENGNLYVTRDDVDFVYSIDVSAVTLSAIPLAINPKLPIADFAYLPDGTGNGLFYGLDFNSNLWSFEPNTSPGAGTVLMTPASSLNPPIPPCLKPDNSPSGYGAAFADSQNKLYFFCNGSGVLYRVDPITMETDTLQETGIELSANDGAACAKSDGLLVTTFTLPDVSGQCGEQICLDLTVEDFNMIESFGFSVHFDENVLDYVSATFNGLPPINSVNDTNEAIGELGFEFSYSSILPASLPDGYGLVTLCFDIIATTPTVTPVVFADTPESRAISPGIFLGVDGSVTIDCNMMLDTIPCTDTSVFYFAFGEDQFSEYQFGNAPVQTGTIADKVNAMGYNVLDGYIYGVSPQSNNLIRIGDNGNSVDLGPINGLTVPIGGALDSGDFDENGNLYVTETNSNTMYVIDVDATVIQATSIALSQPMGVDDISCLDGKFYGLKPNGTNSELIEFDPLAPTTSNVNNLGTLNSATPCTTTFGASFTNNSGNLYFYCNSDAKLYEVTTSLQSTLVDDTNLPVSTAVDGAACSKAEGLITPDALCGYAAVSCFSGFNNNNPNAGTADDIVLALVDVREHATAPLGTNWHTATNNKIIFPNWTSANLGQIFGIDIDNATGDIYATGSTIYGRYLPTGISNTSYGNVYKINSSTGAITTLATLPQDVNNPAGLGDVWYDEAFNQLFVSNFYDGKIYRIDATSGTVLAPAFDFQGTAQNVSVDPGFIELGERVWAVARNEDRLYFSVWVEDSGRPDINTRNKIYSVTIDASGDFSGTAIHEFDMPSNSVTFPNGTSPSFAYSSPVSDIDFSNDGTMLVAERTMVEDLGDAGGTNLGSIAHKARVFTLTRVGSNWTEKLYYVGNHENLPLERQHSNSAGGIDFGYESFVSGENPTLCDSMIWTTGDALRIGGSNDNIMDPVLNNTITDRVYGIAGIRFSGNSTISSASDYVKTSSIYIDLDGFFTPTPSIKTQYGDLEVFKCLDCPREPVIDCDSLMVMSNSISQPTDTTCCYSIDLKNQVGNQITKVCVDINTPDWIFNTGSLILNSGYTWETNTGTSICFEHTGSFPTGNLSNVLEFCLAETDPAAGSSQELIFSWFVNDKSVVCRDTIYTDCIAPVAEQPCVTLDNFDPECSQDSDYEYCVSFDVTNNSTFPVFALILENLPAGYAFADCGCGGSPYNVTDYSYDWPLNSPLGIGSTETLCVKIISGSPIFDPTDICINASLEGLPECCSSSEDFCFTLNSCCDPCSSITTTAVEVNDTCCYSLNIDYGCDYEIFTKIEFDIITPDVYFGNHFVGDSDWNVCNTPSLTNICIEPTTPEIAPGNYQDLFSFCLTDIDIEEDIQQIHVKYWTIGPDGQDSLACDTILTFECDPIDSPCSFTTNEDIQCIPDSSKYRITLTVQNVAIPNFTAEQINFWPTNSFTPNPVTLTPPLANDGTTRTVSFCYVPNTFPDPDGLASIVYRLKDIDGDSCCNGNQMLFDTLFLPQCDSIGMGNCMADFITTEDGCGAVTFTDQSFTNGNIVNWDWTIDGPPVSNASSFTQNFTSSGTYYVCLTITDDEGCTDTHCRNIQVTVDNVIPVATICPADFSVQAVLVPNTNTCLGSTSLPIPVFSDNSGVSLSPTVSIAPALGTLNNNVVSDLPPGVYTITWIAEDICGNIGRCIYQLTVLDCQSCSALFSVQMDSCGRVVFTDQSTAQGSNIVNWDWKFGDGNTSSTQNPSHTYLQAGNYDVMLTITTSSGCQSTYPQNISVNFNDQLGINCPPNAIVNTDPGECIAIAGTPTASPGLNPCLPTPTITCTRDDNPSNLSDPYPLGVTTIGCTADYGGGRTIGCIYTVTVVDNEPPTINCPNNITETGSMPNGAQVILPAPTGTDNCSANYTGTHSTGQFPCGTTTVIYTADDGANAPVTCSFDVIVDCPMGCECGNWSEVRINTGGLIFNTRCGLAPFVATCEKDLFFNGSFDCDGCEASDISAELITPSGTVQVLTKFTPGSPTSYKGTILGSQISQMGNYKLVITGICEGRKCICEIDFVIDSCPDPVCDCPFDATNIQGGIVISNDWRTCNYTFNHPALTECDNVDWELRGVGIPPFMVPLPGNIPFTGTLVNGQVYKIFMTINRTTLDGRTCTIKRSKKFLAQCGQPSVAELECVAAEPINNPSFEGRDNWEVVSGEPDLIFDPSNGYDAVGGSVWLTGNKSSKDVIQQQLSFDNNLDLDYSISFAINGMKGTDYPGARLVIQTIDPETNQPETIEELMLAELPQNDWVPEQDAMFTKYIFNSLIIFVENDVNDPEFKTEVGIDFICVQGKDPICCDDELTFMQDVGQGFTLSYIDPSALSVTVSNSAIMEDCTKLVYDWGDGNSTSVVPANASYSHTYQTPGSYTICMNATQIDDSGMLCNDTTFCQVEVPVSTDDFFINNEISVFPNPTEGALFIKRTGKINNEVSIRIMDLTGKEVGNSMIKSGAAQSNINLADFAQGLYLIELKTENGEVGYKRIIKQ